MEIGDGKTLENGSFGSLSMFSAQNTFSRVFGRENDQKWCEKGVLSRKKVEKRRVFGSLKYFFQLSTSFSTLNEPKRRFRSL